MMIRRASLNDVPAIATLHRDALSKNWSRESFEQFITSPTNYVWIAEQESTLIAFLITQTVAGETEIISLAVAPEHRREGIASQMMQHAPAPCFLEVRADNENAIAFYQKHNFLEVGCRKNYYSTSTGKVDALIMQKLP